jgi:hypothetical protein
MKGRPSRRKRRVKKKPLERVPTRGLISLHSRKLDLAILDSDRILNLVAAQLLFDLGRLIAQELLKSCGIKLLSTLTHTMLGFPQGFQQLINLSLLVIGVGADHPRGALPRSLLLGAPPGKSRSPFFLVSKLFAPKFVVNGIPLEQLVQPKSLGKAQFTWVIRVFLEGLLNTMKQVIRRAGFSSVEVGLKLDFETADAIFELT